jgi:hypothetical protein
LDKAVTASLREVSAEKVSGKAIGLTIAGTIYIPNHAKI